MVRSGIFNFWWFKNKFEISLCTWRWTFNLSYQADLLLPQYWYYATFTNFCLRQSWRCEREPGREILYAIEPNYLLNAFEATDQPKEFSGSHHLPRIRLHYFLFVFWASLLFLPWLFYAILITNLLTCCLPFFATTILIRLKLYFTLMYFSFFNCSAGMCS